MSPKKEIQSADAKAIAWLIYEYSRTFVDETRSEKSEIYFRARKMGKWHWLNFRASTANFLPRRKENEWLCA